MNDINKILVTTEKNYKIVDSDENEIGEIKETYNHMSGNYSYCAMRMFSYGNYRIVGVYRTEKTALKHLLEDKKGKFIEMK